MPLDGIFLHHLTKELQCLIGCRADKIHQPSRDELVFLLRSASFTGKLLITLRSGSARLHITTDSFDNPAEPPAFCKLLRKHLSSAKLTDITQNGLDRTVTLRFMSYNEMGDTVYPFLVVELITGRSNLILCDEKGRILDALHRSDIEKSPRLIQPGAMYTPPEKEDKLNPFTSTAEEMADRITGSKKAIGSAFTGEIDGVSPLVSRELASKVCSDIDISACLLSKDQIKKLTSVLGEFKNILKLPSPHILKEKGGSLRDFCYMPIHQYSGDAENLSAEGFSTLLESFYSEKDRTARIKAGSQDILRLLTNIKNRTLRKQTYRLADLEKCKNREQYRIYGELLKANLYSIEKGAQVARVQNYYDEAMGFIDIPLDPSISPTANAAKYFKEYKKSYTAEQTLTQLVAKDNKELAYIDSVLDSLSRAKTVLDLNEIREELCEAGYIIRRQKSKKAIPLQKPKEYVTKTGFKILVGRNNKENDLLTTKTAGKHDLWFHTKNIPGSHVILFTQGKEVDDQSLLYAAGLAAGHSKAAAGENVPVDYTEVKNVKKPAGSKPGMVIYTTNKTIYAKPLE